MRYIYLLLLIATTAATAQEPSKNMTLFDRLNPVDTAGPHSALWGYTAPDGREYALFGSQIGTYIIDITSKPVREVAFIAGPKNPWREMKVYGKYAYIVAESHEPGGGLQIVDLSDLPRSATLVRTDTTHFVSCHTIYIRDHYLYAMGSRKTPDGAATGLIMLDLAPDPLNPRRVGEVNPYYYHDGYVRNDTLLGSAVYGEGLDIYDIRDKANPRHMATITYPGSGTHNAELSPDGRYVATTDEIGATAKTLKVWDISSLDNITKVADYTAVPEDVVHNVHFKGRYAAVAWYTAGVRMIDMIDPTHPREVGFYDTYPGASGSYNGVWEVYPYFASGKIIASDRQTGLWVFEFNNAVAGSVSGVVKNARTGEPLAGVRITISGRSEPITTDAAGRYYIGGAIGDELVFHLRKFTFGGLTRTVGLAGDLQQDILLEPLPMAQLDITTYDAESGERLDGFSYAIEPYHTSRTAVDSHGVALLERDSSYVVTVGRWGYALQRRIITMNAQNRTLDVRLSRRYQDDATLDLGWSYEDPSDRAETGRWTRIIPYLGTPSLGWVQPATGPTGAPRDYIFVTGAPVPGGSPFSNDVSGGTTTLTSPLMDLTDHPDPEIAFDLWYVLFERDTVLDSLVVEMTADDGASWVQLYTEVQGRSGWHTHRVYPRGLLPITSTMRIRFRASDTLGNALVIAGMDNFDIGPSLGTSDTESTESVGAALSLSVSPNPARGAATVVVESPRAGSSLRVELFDARGGRVATLFEGSTGEGTMRLRVGDDLAEGWYYLRATLDGVTSVGEGFLVVR